MAKFLTINKKPEYTEIVAAEGYVVTAYKEGDDALEYGSVICVPNTAKIADFHAMKADEAALKAKELEDARIAAYEASKEESHE